MIPVRRQTGDRDQLKIYSEQAFACSLLFIYLSSLAQMVRNICFCSIESVDEVYAQKLTKELYAPKATQTQSSSLLPIHTNPNAIARYCIF